MACHESLEEKRERTIAWSGDAPGPVQEGRDNTGEYQLLYKYLCDRYANRVVLTFAEKTSWGSSCQTPISVFRLEIVWRFLTLF